MHRTERLRLALPDSCELPDVCNHLRACGFDIPELSGPGLHLLKDPLGQGVDFEVFKLAPTDVGTYVEHGIAQLGIKSTDVIRETAAQVWRPFTFAYGVYPLVLAAPRGLSFDNLSSRRIMRLATSLPSMTRQIFTARGLAIEVVSVEDSPTACLLGLADGFVDRLLEPKVLIQHGFRVLEVVGHARLKLVLNRACYAMRRTVVSALIERLHNHMPCASTPIEIPFEEY